MNNSWLEFACKIKELYGKDFVPLHEPIFDGHELSYVSDCIHTGWVSSVGQYVNQFEEKLAEFIGVKYAVVVVNGTAALQIALKAAGVNDNEEVLMPSLTFIATANAASYVGAFPHFVDVSEKTLGIDPCKLDVYLQENTCFENDQLINNKTNRIIRAVVPMHTFGHPVELDQLMQVCEKYRLVLVEDAAESLGSYYKGKHTGCFGKVSAMSFNGNKIITTGGGGAILTNDATIAKYAKHITTTAKIPHEWEYVHDEIGYNYRMPNINAALGCAQLERIHVKLEQKRIITEKYQEFIRNLDGVSLFTEPAHCKSNYWLQTLVLEPGVDRDHVLRLLNASGVMSRPVWRPLHQLDMYSNCSRMSMDTTEELSKRIINIPSTPIGENT